MILAIMSTGNEEESQNMIKLEAVEDSCIIGLSDLSSYTGSMGLAGVCQLTLKY
jgi:hypothetical protein